MTGQDRRRDAGTADTRKANEERKGTHPATAERPDASARDVPPVGGVPAGSIRSVDLEPRSNGETEWQDEPEGPETSPGERSGG